MKICKNCGAYAEDNMRFCKNCGNALEAAQASAQSSAPYQPYLAQHPEYTEHNSKKGLAGWQIALIVIGITVGVIAFLCVFFVMLFSLLSSDENHSETSNDPNVVFDTNKPQGDADGDIKRDYDLGYIENGNKYINEWLDLSFDFPENWFDITALQDFEESIAEYVHCGLFAMDNTNGDEIAISVEDFTDVTFEVDEKVYINYTYDWMDEGYASTELTPVYSDVTEVQIADKTFKRLDISFDGSEMTETLLIYYKDGYIINIDITSYDGELDVDSVIGRFSGLSENI